jgi:leader peptidase (prepilin peptidase)/N-methyltransferase
MCLFTALLVELTVSDLESLFLPDPFTLGGTALGVLAAAFIQMEPGVISVLLAQHDSRLISVAESIAGAAFASLVLWAVGWIYEKIRGREGLGFGDVKLIAMIGAFLGIYRTIFVLMLGSIAGSIVGIIYIYLARKDPSTYELPYGSFLGAAALFYIYAGRYFFN